MRNTVKRLPTMLLLTLMAGCGDEPMSYGAGTDAGTSGVQAAVVGSPRDRDALAGILDVFDATWGVDASGYAAQYAGAEWVGPDGTILTDPAAIEGVYAFLFSGPLAGTTRESSIRNLTFLTGTIAVLDIAAQVTTQFGTIRALERNILLKRAGEWRIILHQQVLVTAGA